MSLSENVAALPQPRGGNYEFALRCWVPRLSPSPAWRSVLRLEKTSDRRPGSKSSFAA